MATTINCPACDKRLSVPEELLGRTVRCPSCSHTFTAAAASEADDLPVSLPVEEERTAAPDDAYEEDYVDRRRRKRRRDLKPHRGTTILVLGILSLVMGCAGMVLGPMAWSMGSNDLAEIRAGRMDPQGESATNAGRICGIIGTILQGISLLCGLGYLLLVFGLGAAGVFRKL